MSFALLDFQKAAVNTLKQMLFTSTQAVRVLLQSATGSGKTVIGADFIKDYLEHDNKHKVLCLVNLQALVGQFHDTFKSFDIPVSVLHDEITKNKDGVAFVCDYERSVLITMPETFVNTRAGLNKLHFDIDWDPTLILIDEAHKGTSALFQMIRDMYPEAHVLGMTATPYRDKNKDGECLVEWYGTNLITTVSVLELIEMGRLVQPKYFSMDGDAHVVNTWLEMTEDSEIKSTIVFTRDTKHSFAMRDAFTAAGIAAEVITAGTDSDPDFYVTPQTPLQRQRIYNDYDAGKITVLISVSALCEGFDCPRAKFCFLNRGVGNPALFHQMIGRVLRAYEGKDYGVIVDFHGNIFQHGHIEEYLWSLEAAKPDTMFVRGERDELSIESYLKKSNVFYRCESCNHVYDIKKHSRCTHCRMKHNIKIIAKVSDLMTQHFGEMDKKGFGEFTARLRAANDNDMARQLVNKRYGQIFDEDGCYLPQYNFLTEAMIRGWTSVIQVAA